MLVRTVCNRNRIHAIICILCDCRQYIIVVYENIIKFVLNVIMRCLSCCVCVFVCALLLYVACYVDVSLEVLNENDALLIVGKIVPNKVKVCNLIPWGSI